LVARVDSRVTPTSSIVTFQPARNSDQEHETPLGPDPTTMAFGVGSLTMSSGFPSGFLRELHYTGF
jgi:hypothetical protein